MNLWFPVLLNIAAVLASFYAFRWYVAHRRRREDNEMADAIAKAAKDKRR